VPLCETKAWSNRWFSVKHTGAHLSHVETYPAQETTAADLYVLLRFLAAL